MLEEFIVSHRTDIIDRARRRMSERMAPKSSDTRQEHGVPILLTQIVDALAAAKARAMADPIPYPPPVIKTCFEAYSLASLAGERRG